jgi:hypothetical protein
MNQDAKNQLINMDRDNFDPELVLKNMEIGIHLENENNLRLLEEACYALIKTRGYLDLIRAKVIALRQECECGHEKTN